MDDSTISEFHNSCIYGDLEKVKIMVNQNRKLVNSRDEYGFTALHNIGAEEVYEVALFLIQNGADVNAENDERVTPIFTAVDLRVLEILIQNGANLNHKSKNGSTALTSFASELDCEDNIELLLKNGADKTIVDNQGQSPADIANSREEFDKINLLEAPEVKKPWWKFW